MAVKTMEEILESLKGMIGEEPTDEDIAMLEDITDTFKDFEEKTSDVTNWKNKYEENDKEWRKKYLDRFLRKDDVIEVIDNIDINNKTMKTFDDLFTVKE